MSACLQRAFVSALLVALTACGGDVGPTGPGGGPNGSHFTARIDGAPWTSTSGSELSGVPLSTPGLYSMTGFQVGGYLIVLVLYNIPGPGTYPLGVGPTVTGGYAQITDATGGWVTPQSGEAGSVTITTLTASRMTGTFEFTAPAFTGTATGTRTVTDGSFDLEVKPSGPIGPLPPNAGGRVSATLAGQPFNAAAAASALITSPITLMTIIGQTETRSLTISLADVSAPGNYALSSNSPVRSIGVSGAANPFTSTWSSQGAGSSGTVNVTSVTASRIQGTFSATLGPAPGTQTAGNLTVTNGVFDIGRN